MSQRAGTMPDRGEFTRSTEPFHRELLAHCYRPPRQREVLAFPAADVADMLGTTTAAVKSALQRARARLQQVAPDAGQVTEPGEPEARALQRQWELLGLVAAGHTNAQIGRRLGVTEGTVRKHLENVYTRLQVSSRTAAVTRAFPDGWPGSSHAPIVGGDTSPAASGRPDLNRRPLDPQDGRSELIAAQGMFFGQRSVS
jgi:Bacterial regulatory proteins, luxR family